MTFEVLEGTIKLGGRDVPTWWVFAGAVGSSLLMTVCALSLPDKEEAPSRPAVAAPPAPAGPTATELAFDAAAAVRYHYELAQRANDADWKAADCRDKVRGYERILSCQRAALAQIESAAELLPRGRAAKHACGIEIQKESADYVEVLRSHRAAQVDWLTKASPRGRLALQGHTIKEACSANRELCSGEPVLEHDMTELNSVECTKDLFICLPGRDNVCWINKVADRLKEGAPGTLLVRATGVPVQ